MSKKEERPGAKSKNPAPAVLTTAKQTQARSLQPDNRVLPKGDLTLNKRQINLGISTPSGSVAVLQDKARMGKTLQDLMALKRAASLLLARRIQAQKNAKNQTDENAKKYMDRAIAMAMRAFLLKMLLKKINLLVEVKPKIKPKKRKKHLFMDLEQDGIIENPSPEFSAKSEYTAPALQFAPLAPPPLPLPTPPPLPKQSAGSNHAALFCKIMRTALWVLITDKLAKAAGANETEQATAKEFLNAIKGLSDAEFIEFVESLGDEERAELVDGMSDEQCAEIMSGISAEELRELVGSLSDEELADPMSTMVAGGAVEKNTVRLEMKSGTAKDEPSREAAFRDLLLATVARRGGNNKEQLQSFEGDHDVKSAQTPKSGK